MITIDVNYARSVTDRALREAEQHTVKQLTVLAQGCIERAASEGWHATKLDCKGFHRPVVVAVQRKLQAAGFTAHIRMQAVSEESDTMYIYWHESLFGK